MKRKQLHSSNLHCIRNKLSRDTSEDFDFKKPDSFAACSGGELNRSKIELASDDWSVDAVRLPNKSSNSSADDFSLKTNDFWNSSA